MTDFDALVTEATNPRTFSVLDAIKSRSYPQDIVTVYTDVNSAYDIHRIEEKIADLTDADQINALDQVIAEFKDKIKASALTFRMRGLPREQIDAINDEAHLKFPWTDKTAPDPVDRGIGGEWVNRSFIAAHIVDVTDADGNVDSHKWNADEVAVLRGRLPDESFLALIRLMQELSFAATYFDASVTPDFS
jgi:hypothetical protein